ncbi:MAG: ABC transporter permease [Spirochaetaceae bacterium]
MQTRKGSALTGLNTVVLKEMRDYLGSVRMKLLMALILLTALASTYGAARRIRSLVGEDPFLLLSLFTVSRDPVPSFTAFLGLLVPLAGIALGFDAINSEFSRRTLSRILSQPIYRDVLIVGKALAAIGAVALALLALWLLIIGGGMLFFGIPPTGEQVARALTHYVVTVLYAAVWIVLAMVFSVLFRQPATSALASLGAWLFLTIFWPIVAGALANGLADPGTLAQVRWETALARFSPNTIYGEATLALLNPATRSLGPVVFAQLERAILGTPLPLGVSLLLIWPHVTGLTAATLLFFAGAYVAFQRQEIRA